MLALLFPRPVAPFYRSFCQSRRGRGGISGFYRQQTLFRQHYSSTTVRSAALAENPTLQWKGASLSTSEFANHVIVEADEAPMPVLEAVERVLSGRRQRQPLEPITELTSEELIGMGSVWFLPESAPRDRREVRNPSAYRPPTPLPCSYRKEIIYASITIHDAFRLALTTIGPDTSTTKVVIPTAATKLEYLSHKTMKRDGLSLTSLHLFRYT
jgi:hypothetical protein